MTRSQRRLEQLIRPTRAAWRTVASGRLQPTDIVSNPARLPRAGPWEPALAYLLLSPGNPAVPVVRPGVPLRSGGGRALLAHHRETGAAPQAGLAGEASAWEECHHRDSLHRYALVFAPYMNAGSEAALSLFFDRDAGPLKLQMDLAGGRFAAAVIKGGFASQSNLTVQFPDGGREMRITPTGTNPDSPK